MGEGGVTRDRVIKPRLIAADICQESANEPSNGSFARRAPPVIVSLRLSHVKIVIGKHDGDLRERSPGEVRGVRLQNSTKVDQQGLSVSARRFFDVTFRGSCSICYEQPIRSFSLRRPFKSLTRKLS